jgi:hypothetical protein
MLRRNAAFLRLVGPIMLAMAMLGLLLDAAA